MRYYIIAGEASGDLPGSNLMKGIYAEDPQADIRFWGGDLMESVWKSHTSLAAGGGSGFTDRATPLAAGGGAHSTGVGGVVFQPVTPDAEDKVQVSAASSRINVTDNSALGLPRAVVRIACSKGTYVRAFARDLGEALGSGAHLDSLQRSRSGIFHVEKALTVDQTISILSERVK